MNEAKKLFILLNISYLRYINNIIFFIFSIKFSEKILNNYIKFTFNNN